MKVDNQLSYRCMTRETVRVDSKGMGDCGYLFKERVWVGEGRS